MKQRKLAKPRLNRTLSSMTLKELRPLRIIRIRCAHTARATSSV